MIRRVCEMNKLKYPLITQKVMLDRFVDDIETGDDKEEVVEEIKVNVNLNTYVTGHGVVQSMPKGYC